MKYSEIDDIINSKIDKVTKYSKSLMSSGLLAGIYISLGSFFMSSLKAAGFNILICGMGFSIGLFMVVMANGELFTGNCLASGLCRSEQYHKVNLLLQTSYLANLFGSLIMVFFIWNLDFDKTVLIDICKAKCSYNGFELFIRGILCNMLVCIAIWCASYSSASSSAVSKFTCIVPFVTAFIFCGFEHSIANMFFLPFGVLSGEITILQAITQIFIVTIGNWFGGINIGYLLSATITEE